MPFRAADEGGPTAFVPADPFARFMEIHDALEAQRGWLGDRVPLRFAAVTLLTTPGTGADLAQRLRGHDAQLRERFGWLSHIGSSIRLLLAAILVKYDDDAEAFADEVERVRALFRNVSLRRGGAYEFLAVMVLRRVRGGAAIVDDDVTRFAALYEEMKRHHWFLTGPDDFPACAMLVGRSGEPRQIGEGIEAIYQSLRRDADLYRGEALQTAANVLYLSELDAPEVARRFALLAGGFRQAGHRIGQREYDEIATLCFLAQPVDRIVESVVEYREQLRDAVSWLSRPMAFSLGAGLAFVRLVGMDAQLGPLADAKLLLDMQAIIAARQAAAAAAAA
jgi:hypothetical protein